jgi:hypothetical protein
MNQSWAPAETLICPGHGPLTTVAEEKQIIHSSYLHAAGIIRLNLQIDPALAHC